MRSGGVERRLGYVCLRLDDHGTGVPRLPGAGPAGSFGFAAGADKALNVRPGKKTGSGMTLAAVCLNVLPTDERTFLVLSFCKKGS